MNRSVPTRGDHWKATLREADNEIWVALAFVVLVAIGWWVGSLALSIVGALGALTSATLYLWQRECLTAVSYHRSLGAERAEFGDEVAMSIEIVNDKLLPVSWLHIEDVVPSSLVLRGGNVRAERGSARLVNVLPVLPYQRVRRRVTVECRERGVHYFGPATLRSGDPVGLRSRSVAVPGQLQLLVYPKRFVLEPAGLVSRVLVGDVRTHQQFLEDPSRMTGVREYRAGDPLRWIDWRATARTTVMLVRVFEPTVNLRVALFVDFWAPHLLRWFPDTSRVELTIAIAASLASDLVERGVEVGLFGSGSVDGAPLAIAPSSAPSQLALVLEALARCSPVASAPLSSVLSAECGHLRWGTSVVVVACDFPEPTLDALAELRRRHAVTAVWVRGEQGRPPPEEHVDTLLQAEHTDDWRDKDILELAL